MADQKGHPLQDSFNQLLRNQARENEPKRRSWWPSRKGTTALNAERKEHVSSDQAEQTQVALGSPSNVQGQGILSIPQDSIAEPPAIQLVEDVRPEQRITRRATKSDGGSVGSNLKKLSIDDRRGTQQPASPKTAARTKRAADTTAPFPESETRPSKRTGAPYTSLNNQADPAVSAKLPATDSIAVNPTLQAGLLQLSRPLSSRDSTLYEVNDDEQGYVTKMLLQPETRPITQDQLVNEVKGIYAGLVMVEKKCVEIDQQQSKTTNKLSDEQWQALIALHRTLLYEHHDFFLASQHPSSSAALRRLATKYAMPARMWRHGIHSFLELLRHRLPDSLDHMLAFVYLAYSMMALLMESVPSFVETWIECLGDLARYRMAIEEIDLRDREIWSVCAKMWYEKAADKSPNVGRIQHHLAVLARPNIVQQLFYYSKALVSVNPFQNARESIMLLFNPFLQEGEIVSQKYIASEAAFVKFHGILFTHGSVKQFLTNTHIFLSAFDAHIGRSGSKFRTQGPEIVSSLCAATYDYGNQGAFLMKAFKKDAEKREAEEAAAKETQQISVPSGHEEVIKLRSVRSYWESLRGGLLQHTRAEARTPLDFDMDSKFPGTEEVAAQAVRLLGQTTRIVTQRIGDKNIVSYMHVLLGFLWGLAHVEDALLYVEGDVPWEGIITFLNTLGRSGVDESRVLGDDFPRQLSGNGRQLPEDFLMRGLVWAQHFFPTGFFEGQVVDEDERTLDLPSHAAPRAERCLWVGNQLAQLGRWLGYDKESKQFSITEYARSLAVEEVTSVYSDGDVRMLD